MEKSDAAKLLDSGSIVIKKVKYPNEEEVLRKMSMFDTVGVGVDWIEVKRQKDEAVAEERRKARAIAKKARESGMSAEEILAELEKIATTD